MEFENATIYTLEKATERMKQLPFEIFTAYGKAQLQLVPADLAGYINYLTEIQPRFIMANEVWAQQDSKDGKVKLAYMCLTGTDEIYVEFVE